MKEEWVWLSALGLFASHGRGKGISRTFLKREEDLDAKRPTKSE